jgi:hypothetical protein
MKNFKPILLLALVFIAGVVIGAVANRSLVRHAVRQSINHPDMVQTAFEQQMDHRLRLDNDQQAKLHDIFATAHLKMREIQLQVRPQTAQVASNVDLQVSGMLDADQLRRYQELKSENGPLVRFLRQPR